MNSEDSMERLLQDKVCIITGAAQGIGKGIAERFAADGAIVYACDLREGSMDEWAASCGAENNTRIVPMYFDVSDAAAVKNAFMSIFKTEKRIDALVNNAGVVFNKKIGMIVRDVPYQCDRGHRDGAAVLAADGSHRWWLDCEYRFCDGSIRFARTISLFGHEGGDYLVHQVGGEGTGPSGNPCECGGSWYREDGTLCRTL